MGEHSFMDQYVRPPQASPPRGFSLAALFLLLTTAGVVAALARNASLNTNWRLNEQSTFVLVHVLIGVIVGACVGLFVGLSYPRRLAGSLIGASVGAVSGGICAGVATAGASLWVFASGAMAIVLLGILVRLGQRRN